MALLDQPQEVHESSSTDGCKPILHSGQSGCLQPSIRLAIALSLLMLASCMQARYVVQAGLGQAELWSLARDVDDVIADPDTDERTRVLLKESQVIMGFARKHGFRQQGNYKQFVELDRGQVVWFLAASKELSFEPVVWNFPLVGSFPYLGWFSRDEATVIRKRLEKRGLDVYVRKVSAYSTGGWLQDPILSTMLSSEDDAFRYLSNVLIHELTHANLLVDDQATFNESLASFVGDTMAEEYLAWRFGAASEEVRLYREEQEESQKRGEAFAKVYQELSALYAKDLSSRDKRKSKARIIGKLQLELGLAWRPNNAALQGFKVYNTGSAEFSELFVACGQKWAPFFQVIRNMKARDFPKEQSDEISPVVLSLKPRCKALAETL